MAALTLLAAAALVRGLAHGRYRAGQTYADVYYVPPAVWLPALSLGYREAMADLLWTRALVYFGDEMRQRGRVAHVFDYAEAMLALDPHFRAVYRWVGVAGVYRPQPVSPADIRRAIDFLKEGSRRFPEDGELAWTLGATLAFELSPLLDDPEQKRRVQAQAAEYLSVAVRLGAAPDWAVLTNAALLGRVGRAEQAARHLEEMFLTVDDPRTRAAMAERIRELRSEVEAEAFVHAMEDGERRRLRSFPYLSPTLFLMVGERPPLDILEPLKSGF